MNLLLSCQQTKVTFVTSHPGVYKMSSPDAGSFPSSAISGTPAPDPGYLQTG